MYHHYYSILIEGEATRPQEAVIHYSHSSHLETAGEGRQHGLLPFMARRFGLSTVGKLSLLVVRVTALVLTSEWEQKTVSVLAHIFVQQHRGNLGF